MSPQDIEELFIGNMNQLNILDIASASMLKALVQALEDNGNVYIHLEGAVAGGHAVSFSYVAGNQAMIEVFATALGVVVAGDTLEVNHA
jgi:hypothetical protein